MASTENTASEKVPATVPTWPTKAELLERAQEARVAREAATAARRAEMHVREAGAARMGMRRVLEEVLGVGVAPEAIDVGLDTAAEQGRAIARFTLDGITFAATPDYQRGGWYDAQLHVVVPCARCGMGELLSRVHGLEDLPDALARERVHDPDDDACAITVDAAEESPARAEFREQMQRRDEQQRRAQQLAERALARGLTDDEQGVATLLIVDAIDRLVEAVNLVADTVGTRARG